MHLPPCLRVLIAVAVVGWLSWPALLLAEQAVPIQTKATYTDWGRVVSLRDHNTRMVLLGTGVFGALGGLVGTFLLLRKRSLMSDTISHATLPGIATAFLIADGMGGDGRRLSVLLVGAAVTGLIGMGAVMWIREHTRLKDDAALAIVLSVFFGFGVALLTVVQQLPSGNAAGLEYLIYGKAASMTESDARWIIAAAVLTGLACLLLFKEFTLLCFDDGFAATQGWPVRRLDALLLGLITLATVVGLQAVGLLLVVAMMIIPTAAARFWTDRLDLHVCLAVGFGVASGVGGVMLSALFPRLPAGALIVLCGFGLFMFGMVFGRTRGLWLRWMEHRRLGQRVQRQHFLRAVFEWLEAAGRRNDLLDDSFPLEGLRPLRAWGPGGLERACAAALRGGDIRDDGDGRAHLTGQGAREALRVVRNHRLWELFLIRYADSAPGRVDRDADAIEHVLEPDILKELEGLLESTENRKRVPSSPHEIATNQRFQGEGI